MTSFPTARGAIIGFIAVHCILVGFLNTPDAAGMQNDAAVTRDGRPADDAKTTDHADMAVPFGEAGKFKMLYDARQRPQALLLHDQIYIVYNGDAKPTSNGKGSARPMLITYDPQTRQFSESTRLGPRSSDHHFSPVLWADKDDFLHILFGCHKTPGTHLISQRPIAPGRTEIEWREGPQIAPKLSYPAVFRVSEDRQLIYYRTDGHTSSWTYRISDDNGQTWTGPSHDVTDLDSKGHLDWSSYQTKLPSEDGQFLHVVYTDYDDNKNSPDPKRFFNARYQQEVSNEWKYNLSYVKIDLRNGEVRNARTTVVPTPIDRDLSRARCQIWDTQGRGAGVPPAVCLDSNGQPTFLHVLSEDDLETHRYYYVRREQSRWLKTPICDSNHQWNSCHLSRDEHEVLHAYVVVGDGYLRGGYMDRHGGGRIEEWISLDAGGHWEKRQQISPSSEKFNHWRFNNVQPVIRPDGREVPGMLLFYGWDDPELPEAQAFLLHDASKS